MKKNTLNESIGIIALVVGVVLAIVLLIYFYHHSSTVEGIAPSVPLEAPHVMDDSGITKH